MEMEDEDGNSKYWYLPTLVMNILLLPHGGHQNIDISADMVESYKKACSKCVAYKAAKKKAEDEVKEKPEKKKKEGSSANSWSLKVIFQYWR